MATSLPVWAIIVPANGGACSGCDPSVAVALLCFSLFLNGAITTSSSSTPTLPELFRTFATCTTNVILFLINKSVILC
ncbi:hypothetical protein Hamer_G029510 [Homarus americanus]|uniref:Uncharacterized protein n=1 Tax=Homarus americanus TaxID=6706 RepID=A0A8J5JQ67_HOMAM|nr:hypothetical protein Hamer_G029510 [Homarus americanus]